MPVINQGTIACVVRPSWSLESRMVSKIFVTEQSQLAYTRETRYAILNKLQLIDPERRYFAYALPRKPLEYVDYDQDVFECQERLNDPDAVPLVLADVRWFDLDELDAAPAEFSPGQKAYLRSALDRLHAAGIVHNDLHSGNIMMALTGPQESRPRIIDFGEALMMQEIDADEFERRKAHDRQRLNDLFLDEYLNPRKKRRRDWSDDEDERPPKQSPPSLSRKALFS